MPLVRKSDGSPPPPPSAPVLTSSVASERFAAARAMTGVGDISLLGAALAREHDASVREAILTSLCQIATPEAAAAIIPGVRAEDARTRREALDALMSMPLSALPHLPALLGDDDPDVRLLSCEIVRNLPSETATELLIPVLRLDRGVNVCIAAVDVLTEIGDETALAPLAEAQARFPDEAFLHYAIEAARERISGAKRP